MSGLVNTHRERSRAKRRTSAGLSPSKAVGATSRSRGTAAVNAAAVRNWSWPNALVGDR
ncbi:hypothetical protein C1Y40_00349 [Mycobacterium talmoniae]|uniref:Uncharacterized protein n=1 Tax=Mycobacterium talmoniae TaxID=1858794 RepID=A0A2S8BRW6_9MYCO|nr:hypothetical protein C1Y40_00349 [Mycobacterium talmoniae]